MKKFILTLLTIFLIIPVFGIFNSVKVSGETACGLDFEVAYIEDNGSFTKKGCYSDFASAKQAMKDLGGDHVVRHYASLSPSKIVAMNSGLAYSYPGRGNSKTMNIYQHVTDRSIYYKQTYIANHYEMNYYDTERYFIDKNGKGVGMIQVSVNGFEGYTDLEYTDLVPSKFLDNGIHIYLGGNNTYENEDAFLVVPKRNYYEVVRNGNYLDLVFHYYRAYPSNGEEATAGTITVGKASESMKENTRYYSKDGINFYTNTNYSGDCITYYNYYQFLPLRSKSNIDASVLNNYLSSYTNSVMLNQGQAFINAQNTYGVNALLLYAMAIHESAYGTSAYARGRNNLFGWNAYDNSPGSASTFSSVVNCINEQAGINLRGFLDVYDGRFFSSSLGNKGSGLNVKYASDPYWGMKIAGIAYAVDKYSKGKNGTYTDLDVYNLALINKNNVEIKKEANQNSTTLFTTEYGPYYQKDFVVIILEEGALFTKIQSTNGIDENGNLLTHRTPPTSGNLNPISTYDFNRSVAYINSTYLTPLNYKSNEDEIIDDNLSIFSSLDELSIDNNKITISGCAFIKGMNFTNLNKITHEIQVRNIIDDSVVKTYEATTSEYPGIKFNDNHIYTYVGYSGEISLDELESGNYYLAINIKNGEIVMATSLISYNDAYANMIVKNGNTNYHLCTNEIYNNRLELDIDSLPESIKYSEINKPSTRPSLFSFDTFTLDEEGNLYIYGQAMIYYCNYDNKDNIKYTIYLIDDKDNYLEINCTTLESNYDYKSLLKSSYNMDYICFEGSANLRSLNAGNYQMIIKIQNGTNIDYLEMTNISHSDTPTRSISNENYRFYTSNIRDRLMLEVSK